MFTFDYWPQNEPRFPDRIAIQAPRGTRKALKDAADAANTTVSELLRRILAREIGPAAPQVGH